MGALLTLGGLLALAGCAESASSYSGAMLADSTCANLRSELNTLDRQGAPGLIEAKAAGKSSFTPQQQAMISKYNQVLDSYLGGGCASESRYKAKAAGGQTGTSQSAPKKKTAQAQPQ
jgi:hypothetical protein